MLINNVELPDLDIFDADDMKKYESFMKEIQNYTTNEELPASEQYKLECQVIFKAFNNLFGKDTDKLLFGNKMNIKVCRLAMWEIVKEIQRQKEEGDKEFDKCTQIYNVVMKQAEKK